MHLRYLSKYRNMAIFRNTYPKSLFANIKIQVSTRAVRIHQIRNIGITEYDDIPKRNHQKSSLLDVDNSLFF